MGNKRKYLVRVRAGTTGVCVWGGGGGGRNTHKRKVKKGGPGMLELRNVLNIKEFSEKLRSKKSEKVLSYPLSQTSVWKIFWDVLFSEKNIPPPPPPPPPPPGWEPIHPPPPTRF